MSTDADAVKQRMAELLPSAAVKALVAAPTEAPASLTPEKAAEEWKAFLAKPAAGVPADFAAELERIAAAAKFDAAKVLSFCSLFAVSRYLHSVCADRRDGVRRALHCADCLHQGHLEE